MWLERKGWNTGIGRICSKRRNDGSFCYVSTTNELSSALSDIASEEGMNLQGVLREINPRMRQGMPSHAAIKAHDENMMKEGNDSGRWIAVRKCDKNAEVTVVRFVFGLSCVKVWFDTAKGTSDIRHEEGQWSFWPCDHKGNKVRWPSIPALHGGSEML